MSDLNLFAIIKYCQFKLFLMQSLIDRLYVRLYLGKKLHRCSFFGVPEMELYTQDSLQIGAGVTINSKNRYYHLLMFGKCKFVANSENSRIIIGNNTRIHGSCIHARDLVEIGSNVLIAANCQIFDSSGHLADIDDVMKRLDTKSSPRSVHISDGVWLGANTIICPGVTVGKGSVLAAGSVVVKNIPPNVIAGGNPAVVIRTLRNG